MAVSKYSLDNADYTSGVPKPAPNPLRPKPPKPPLQKARIKISQTAH